MNGIMEEAVGKRGVMEKAIGNIELYCAYHAGDRNLSAEKVGGSDKQEPMPTLLSSTGSTVLVNPLEAELVRRIDANISAMNNGGIKDTEKAREDLGDLKTLLLREASYPERIYSVFSLSQMYGMLSIHMDNLTRN